MACSAPAGRRAHGLLVSVRRDHRVGVAIGARTVAMNGQPMVVEVVHPRGIPVDPPAPLDHEDRRTGRRQHVGSNAAAGTAADDDDVVLGLGLLDRHAPWADRRRQFRWPTQRERAVADLVPASGPWVREVLQQFQTVHHVLP